MIELKIIFGILIIHWFADFVLQTDKQAKGKSKNWSDLLGHTFNYSLVWLFVGFGFYLQNFKPYAGGLSSEFYDLVPSGLLFVLITFIAHTITDYFTSRLNSKLWTEGKTHWFFVSIGFDQILHYLQLFLTFYLLTNGS